MKRLFFALFCAGALLVSCSDDEKGGSIKKDQLGMIIKQANTNTKVLLMENGSLIYPVSGIDINEFNNLRLGRKVIVDYTVSDTESGITTVRVHNFALADASTFDPDEPTLDASIFSSTFAGQFFIADVDSSHVIAGDASFTFGAEESGASDVQYSIDPDEGEDVDGQTTFILSDGKIVFTDESGSILLPKKSYNYSFMSDKDHAYFYFWDISDEGAFACYSLMTQ